LDCVYSGALPDVFALFHLQCRTIHVKSIFC